MSTVEQLIWVNLYSLDLNPIPTGQGQNQPLYEHHVTKSGRNRVNEIKLILDTPGMNKETKLTLIGSTGKK